MAKKVVAKILSKNDTREAKAEALKQALGDKKGIRRFADATVPLDEALAKAVTDAGYKVAGIE